MLKVDLDRIVVLLLSAALLLGTARNVYATNKNACDKVVEVIEAHAGGMPQIPAWRSIGDLPAVLEARWESAKKIQFPPSRFSPLRRLYKKGALTSSDLALGALEGEKSIFIEGIFDSKDGTREVLLLVEGKMYRVQLPSVASGATPHPGGTYRVSPTGRIQSMLDWNTLSTQEQQWLNTAEAEGVLLRTPEGGTLPTKKMIESMIKKSGPSVFSANRAKWYYKGFTHWGDRITYGNDLDYVPNSPHFDGSTYYFAVRCVWLL